MLHPRPGRRNRRRGPDHVVPSPGPGGTARRGTGARVVASEQTTDDAPRDALPEGGPWSPAYRSMTAGLLLGGSVIAFEALAVATVLPETVADLHGLGLYGAAFSAFLLTDLVGIVAAGLLADRDGPARPFLFGVLLFAAGLLVGGFAPTMVVLVLGRALQGFGAGAVGAVAYVALGRAYPPSAKPTMLAYLSTAWVVPGLVGPAAAGLIGEAFGWRWVFLGLIPLPLLAAALAYPALRPIPGGDAAAGNGAARLRNAALLAVGATLLLTGLSQTNLLLVLPLVVVGVAASLPALAALLPPGTLRARPGLPAAVAVMTLINLAFFGADAFIALILVDVRGQTLAFAGITLTATTIAWTVGSWLQARLVAGGRRRPLVVAGLVLLITGIALFATVFRPSVSPWVSPPAWAVAGVGMGLAYATLSLIVLENATRGQEGEASASLQLAGVLGSGVGAGIGGAVINAVGHTPDRLATALLVQCVAMLGVLALTLLLTPRLPTAPPAR